MFYSNGKVWNGVLAKDSIIHGKSYKAYTAVGFNPDSSVAYSFPIDKEFHNKTPDEIMKTIQKYINGE